MKSFVAVLCVLFVAGCSSVLMKEPFPGSTLTKKEQTELTGNWRLDEQVVHLAFASNGVPWLATVDWENDDFVLNKFRLYFTKRNGSLYVCIPNEPGETNEYSFVEFRLDGDTALVWLPDVDVFDKLVGSGILKGTVEKDKHSKSITLENDTMQVLELVSTNAAAFDYKNPLVFHRLD